MEPKTKTLVVDDEEKARHLIIELLQDYAPQCHVLGQASNCEEAIEIIRTGKPNLIFLDLNLHGESGFKVLEYFGENPPFKTIITTAYEEFALQSYQFEIVDYLLKPITPGNFKKAISKFEARIGFPQNVPELPKPEVRIFTRSGLRYIQVQKIIRLKADRNYSWLYVDQENPILLSKTLALMEEELLPHGFLRPHNTHMVNPAYLQSFERHTNTLILNDGTSLPVSRDRKKTIVEFFARF
jgi:two-component system, LytTR family, response regulator